MNVERMKFKGTMESGELRDRIYRDVVEYFNEFTEPMKLRTLGQRFGKRSQHTSILELLRDDPRFLVRVTGSDSRIVWPKAELMEAFAGDTLNNYLNTFDLKR